MSEDMEREHNKDLLALEQEIEGWKGANRILKAKLEIAQKALEEISGLIDAEAYNLAGDKADDTLIKLKD